MKKLLARIIPFAAFAPLFAFAADANLGYFSVFITKINELIATALPVLFGLAFLVFVWGMFTTFILGGADEEKQKKGKQLMIYAIIGFVVMVSVWGIVNLLITVFGFDTAATVKVPKVPVPQP